MMQVLEDLFLMMDWYFPVSYSSKTPAHMPENSVNEDFLKFSNVTEIDHEVMFCNMLLLIGIEKIIL